MTLHVHDSPAAAAAAPAATAWDELCAAWELCRRRSDSRAVLILESLAESLYAEAHEAGAVLLRELCTLLEATAPLELIAWQKLALFALADSDATLSALDQALAHASARSRWLIASEAARLCHRYVGVQAAWSRVRTLRPVPAEEPWLDDGPLVIHALVTQLRLAAASGHWDEHDALLVAAREFDFEPDDPRALRIQLATADHDLVRGRFASALHDLDRIDSACRGDLRLQLLTLRLHGLVACAGAQRDTDLRELVERSVAELETARATPSDERDCLPPDERAELLRRIDLLVEHAGVIGGVLDAEPNGTGRVCEPETVDSMEAALAVELRARRGHASRPAHEVFAALLPRVEALVLRDDADEHEESWWRLRLLWCRLIVDLGQTARYRDCEQQLTAIADAASRAGSTPLVISALDQRAVVRARAPIDRWDLALEDAGNAGNLAVQLLADSAASDGERVVERALLRMFLPVIDRVIDLLLEGAWAHRDEGQDGAGDVERSSDERWRRFGCAVHDYVEQSQALALKEARRSYGAAAATPHRFAVVEPEQAPEGLMPRLHAGLGARDAVLQYFVTGPYLAIFCYTRTEFDWELVDVVSAVKKLGVRLDLPTAHSGLLQLMELCRGWIYGGNTPEDVEQAASLAEIVLPQTIYALMARVRCKHLRVVPHDVLYRVPFGRIACDSRPLGERVSLSLHPTAGLAVESAQRALRVRGRKILGYLLGPDIAYADEEQSALKDALGRGVPMARVQCIDSQRAANNGEVVDQLQDVSILHVACHGGRPRQRRPAFIKLGEGRERRWTLDEVAALRLERCALVVLQSCWTGWMEHERTNPVQGFPQALCDTGVGAVIAPLVKVPQSLAPVFDGVFYRALRFLTAAQALRVSLAVLREHGPELVAHDPAARRDLEELGSLDAREYRYVGATNLALYGGIIARSIGRLSFWWWRRRLRRQRARRAEAAPHTHCSR